VILEGIRGPFHIVILLLSLLFLISAVLVCYRNNLIGL
jgi:hypothetical protein